MSNLITEQQQSYIRKSIPFMARNIHEGFGSFMRGVGRGLYATGKGIVSDVVAPTLKNVADSVAQGGAHSGLRDAMRIHNEIIIPHVAQHLGYSGKEVDRLWTWGTKPKDKPNKPDYFIKNPNPKSKKTMVPKPVHIFREEMQQYQTDLEDWNKSVKQFEAIQGLVRHDRNFGRMYERLHGVPGGDIGEIQKHKNILDAAKTI
jgi:hypothetical protein